MFIKTKKSISLLSVITFNYYIVVGLALSIFSIILKENNVNDFLIGFSDSIRRLSGIIFMFFIPYIVNRFGLYKTSLASILLYTFAFLLIPFFVNYYIWIFYIIIFGAGMMSFMTFIDAVLNVVINDKDRSKINGIMNTIVLLGIATAPIIFKLTEIKKYYIFAFCGFLSLINILLYSNLKTEYKSIVFIKNLQLIRFIKELPYVFLSKIFLEFLGSTLFVFTIVYLNKYGHSYANSGLLLSIYCLSGLIFSYLTGYLFNKVKDKEKLLIKGTLTTIGLVLFIPIEVYNYTALFLIYFLLGISTGFIHLGCLIITNEKYKKEELVSANSALSIIGSISMMFAGLISGYFMYHFNSIIIGVSILGFIYTFLVFYNRKL